MTSNRRLLIISCSTRKRSIAGLVRAWELYDGVAFRVLKRLERDGLFPDNVDVLILSALYGLIKPDDLIEFYDQRMTKEIALKQAPGNIAKLRNAVEHNRYRSIFINAGQNYLIALQPLEDWLPPAAQLFIAKGRIGQRLKQMKWWLAESRP